MALPARAPAGQQTVSLAGANLFQLAAQYLGDATAWERIADLNGFPGLPPDFLLLGQVDLKIPPKVKLSTASATPVSIETQLFGPAA